MDMKSNAAFSFFNIAIGVVFFLFTAEPSFSKERTAYDVGMSTAKKRGYDNPKCYADVFQTYASYHPQKGWGVRGKGGNAWKIELWDKCRISR